MCHLVSISQSAFCCLSALWLLWALSREKGEKRTILHPMPCLALETSVQVSNARQVGNLAAFLARRAMHAVQPNNLQEKEMDSGLAQII